MAFEEDDLEDTQVIRHPKELSVSSSSPSVDKFAIIMMMLLALLLLLFGVAVGILIGLLIG